MDATPTLPTDASAEVVAALESNYASQAKPAVQGPDRNGILLWAREMSKPGQDALANGEVLRSLDVYPAAVVQAPYGVAEQWLGGDASEGSLVAASRCVWAVTVHAPFEPRSHPFGVAPVIFDSYTAVFDVASGQYLGVSAGTDAGDLITGDRIPKSN